ncbi:4895_t:CDS:2, partial [Funneliformis mosseae]
LFDSNEEVKSKRLLRNDDLLSCILSISVYNAGLLVSLNLSNIEFTTERTLQAFVRDGIAYDLNVKAIQDRTLTWKYGIQVLSNLRLHLVK